MKEKDLPLEKLNVPQIACSCCGTLFPSEAIITLDGENLCKECFMLVEASKDTH